MAELTYGAVLLATTGADAAGFRANSSVQRRPDPSASRRYNAGSSDANCSAAPLLHPASGTAASSLVTGQ